MSAKQFAQLNDWYTTSLGERVAADIHARLEDHLATIFGYHILQLGIPTQGNWLKASPIPHKILLSPDEMSPVANICGDNQELPFANDSIDVVLLPHGLEYTDSPQALLQEINRIIIPDGYLIIIGFNPFSFWGLWHAVAKYKGDAPWGGNFMSLIKLRHYILELGYEIKYGNSFSYRPPIADKSVSKKLLFLETLGRLLWPYPGGAYVVVAKKQVTRLTPIKPLWSFRNIVIGKRFATPASTHILEDPASE